jgi:hypothetical protein
MNEALVFIAIMIATILIGILGALLVVPVLASVVVIGGYLQRRVLGLPPFEDDGSTQFVAPPQAEVPRRKWTKRERRERLGQAALSESDPSEPATVLINDPPPEPPPAQEKIEE